MRLWFLLIALICLSTVDLYAFPLMPNLKETPGDLCDTRNHDFAEFRFSEKIPVCRRDVSWELKQKIYSKYGIPKNCRREYTIDHFIPLSMGGSNHERNLWPEHRKIKNSRFDLEQETFKRMLTGLLTSQQAYELIRSAKMNPKLNDTSDPCMEKSYLFQRHFIHTIEGNKTDHSNP